jgi:hypothetical protein
MTNAGRLRLAVLPLLVLAVLVLILPTTVSANSFSVTYTWTGSELIQSDRLFRDGVTSTCAVAKTYPGAYGGGPQGYLTFPYFNPNPTATCVTVTWTGDPGYNTFLSAYLAPYNPFNMASNYLGDSGVSADLTAVTFGFMVPASSSFLILANTVWGVSSAVGQSFSFTVTGQNIQQNVVPEPTTLLLLGTGLAGLMLKRLRR